MVGGSGQSDGQTAKTFDGWTIHTDDEHGELRFTGHPIRPERPWCTRIRDIVVPADFRAGSLFTVPSMPLGYYRRPSKTKQADSAELCWLVRQLESTSRLYSQVKEGVTNSLKMYNFLRQDDLKLSFSLTGQGVGDGTRTRDRRVRCRSQGRFTIHCATNAPRKKKKKISHPRIVMSARGVSGNLGSNPRP
ncbi:hypothetical protein PoB_001985900 [Plakobranchus ocellatus]|uniref:Uncharacterized protein n=1 Tax=Plakobranchus ocellatus TaxID=259542 RepID=A0AAV3ZHI9_9GAST|nr:hypothetical protein PoB_001985900 [Plakobranchus ocellatus]